MRVRSAPGPGLVPFRGVTTLRSAATRGFLAAFLALTLFASVGAGIARAEPPIPEPRPYAITLYGGQVYSSNFTSTFYERFGAPPR